jgi:hypothetical protein
MVASWVGGGAARFLAELQKTCVVCLVIYLSTMLIPVPRLPVDAVSRLLSVDHLYR